MKYFILSLLLFVSADVVGWFYDDVTWGCVLVNYDGEYRIAAYTDILIDGVEHTFVENGLDDERQIVWKRVDLSEDAIVHELKGCPSPNFDRG